MGPILFTSLVAIVAAPRAGGPIAIVDEHVVSLSVDGGLTYRPLHRVAATESIFDATLAADGALYALHSDVLDVVRNGVLSSQHRAPDARRVAALGATVAVLRNSSVDLSTDGGATFVTRALPPPCEGCAAELDGMTDFTVAGGAPFLVDTSINTCGSSDLLEWQRLVQVGASTFQRTLPIPREDYAAHWHFGAYGWMYGSTYAGRVMAVSAAGAVPVTGIGPVGITESMVVAHDGRVTVAKIGASLVELSGATARVLDAHAKPGDFLAVDGDDRPLVSDGKELWRFSRITGWIKLALP